MPHATGPTTKYDLWTCAGICATVIVIAVTIAYATLEAKRIDARQRTQAEERFK